MKVSRQYVAVSEPQPSAAGGGFALFSRDSLLVTRQVPSLAVRLANLSPASALTWIWLRDVFLSLPRSRRRLENPSHLLLPPFQTLAAAVPAQYTACRCRFLPGMFLTLSRKPYPAAPCPPPLPEVCLTLPAAPCPAPPPAAPAYGLPHPGPRPSCRLCLQLDPPRPAGLRGLSHLCSHPGGSLYQACHCRCLINLQNKHILK